MKSYLLTVRLALCVLLLTSVTGARAAFVFESAAVTVGPASGAGTASLVVTPSGTAWTASSTNAWLHIDVANLSGNKSGLLVFTFDANTGTTRTGTIDVSGAVFTVTQAGAGYEPVQAVNTLGVFQNPYSLLADAAGNIYINQKAEQKITKWEAGTQQTSTFLNTINSDQMAFDTSGNFYFTDNLAVKRWTASTQQITTIYTGTSNLITTVTVDREGNAYFDDRDNTPGSLGNNILKWSPVTQLTSVIAAYRAGITALAIDPAGDLYFAGYGILRKFFVTTQQDIELYNAGRLERDGLGRDNFGNIYFTEGSLVKKYSAATGLTATVAISGTKPIYTAVAVDGSGNLYYGEDDTSVKKMTFACVPTASVTVGTTSGTGALPPVLPVTTPLNGIFRPTSDQPWLVVGDVLNGVVNFSFGYATTTERVGHITVLGKSIAIVQPANIGSGNPPVIDAISISRNPVRTNTDVTFSALARSTSGFPIVSYQWLFFLNDSAVADGPALTTNPVTRQFATEGTYTVAVVAFDGVANSVVSRVFTATLDPNPGSTAQNIFASGSTVMNPANGLGFTIGATAANDPGSVGGVVNLDALTTGAESTRAAGDTYLFTSGGNTMGSNAAIAGKFTAPGVYSIGLTARNGINIRSARLMLPISGPETGAPLSVSDNRKRNDVVSSKVSGKFTAKSDSVNATVEIELPGGLDLSQLGSLDVGISNVITRLTLDRKGKVIGNSNSKQFKKATLKLPKVNKVTGMTIGGELLKVTVTIVGTGETKLTAAGFESDGVVQISNTDVVPLNLQFAAQLAGLTYRGLLKVDYKPSKKDFGSIKSSN